MGAHILMDYAESQDLRQEMLLDKTPSRDIQEILQYPVLA